ncbi:MAG: ornithine cyclodeaminase family protein [Acidobacteria bacterium]|nr:ornithine cyclodeaminase family protein [Acidobacteriota bacterium]
MPKVLLLDEAAVASLLTMNDLIPLMERALAEFSAGRVDQPVRTVVAPAGHHSMLAVMPGHVPSMAALGVKVVTVAPGNADLHLPTHLATILLHDPATGALLALIDGRLVTEMRTAAVSAAASKALARPGARRLAIVGSGVQAHSHLEAFREVHDLDEISVFSPAPASREAFAARESKRHGIRVRPVGSAEEAVTGADLVVVATASPTPVVLGRWLAEGAHVTAVGACVANRREIDGEAVARARVFVDSIAAARVEAGDILLAESEGSVKGNAVAGEIGAVFAGGLPGRTSDRQITLFKSLGLAVEDVAAASHLHRLARERRAGVEISL